MTFLSSWLNSALFTFALGEKARRKPKYKARYGCFSRTKWLWVSLFTVVFQSYKRNVLRYRKLFSVLGIIFAWIQKIMIYISDFEGRILLRSLNTTSVVCILACYISLRYYCHNNKLFVFILCYQYKTRFYARYLYFRRFTLNWRWYLYMLLFLSSSCFCRLVSISWPRIF